MTPDAQPWLAAALPGRRIGHAVEFHATIGSTNDRARAALADPSGDGLAVVADQQIAGRGRQGRTWLTPAGGNLAVSIGLRPRLGVERIGLLGPAVAMAARDACAHLVAPAPIGIRWPNDLVAADGTKLAGILVETSLVEDRVAEAVIGIGINVNWRRAEMPPDIAERASALADLAGRELDRVVLLRTLLERLDAEVTGLERGVSPIDRFRAGSVLTGRWVTVDLGTSRLDGIVTGVADDGSLELQSAAGTRTLNVGEVVSVRDLDPAAGVPA